MQGFFGRQSKQVRFNVCLGTSINQIQPKVEAQTKEQVKLYTDESNAYNRVSTSGRSHATVCHSHREFARDEDGDGFCEVHCNTCEGIWTGVRNFLRPFRGVNKRFIAQYVAMFENAFNLKCYIELFRAMLIPDYTLDDHCSPQ